MPGAPAGSTASASELDALKTLQWKARIAFLWLFLAVGMSAVMVLTILEPGVLSQAIAGKLPTGEEITATITVMFALFWLVPLVMAFLTLALKDSIVRPANLVAGLLASVIWFSDFFEGNEFGAASIVVATMVIAGLLIAWHAWRWPHAQSSGVANG